MTGSVVAMAIGYSEFDPIEDTESCLSISTAAVSGSYSEFDPIEDTESKSDGECRGIACRLQ